MIMTATETHYLFTNQGKSEMETYVPINSLLMPTDAKLLDMFFYLYHCLNSKFWNQQSVPVRANFLELSMCHTQGHHGPYFPVLLSNTLP